MGLIDHKLHDQYEIRASWCANVGQHADCRLFNVVPDRVMSQHSLNLGAPARFVPFAQQFENLPDLCSTEELLFLGAEELHHRLLS